MRTVGSVSTHVRSMAGTCEAGATDQASPVRVGPAAARLDGAPAGSKAAITPQTVFDVELVTEHFTAAAILLLHDAGWLRLEDPLSNYMRSFPSWSEKTTLAHLMHHTSGIPTNHSSKIRVTN